jgi:uncharacterized membrane protein
MFCIRCWLSGFQSGWWIDGWWNIKARKQIRMKAMRILSRVMEIEEMEEHM